MTSKPPLWRQIQRENFTSIEKLCAYLKLDPIQTKKFTNIDSFPLNLPNRLADKIQKHTLDDPILKQFVPLQLERQKKACFVKDPVGDIQALVEPKCLQKYASRVLLVTTSACAMHCRYCFRKNFDYSPLKSGFAQELSLIRKDPSLKEVILSGGDPLSLSNTQLKELTHALSNIPHIKRLRFHTRFPIGIPERIDGAFLDLLETCRVQVWFVIHSNHPKELDGEVLIALKKIQKLGIPVLNQWVLLKGVNDSVEILQTLCEKLVDHGIVPYYLHQLDRVEGAAHFEVSSARGKELVEELSKRLSGYGVPKYVQELVGELSKTRIC